MKRLLIAILVAFLGYSAWWFVAAQQLRTSVEDWFADRRDAGWDASYSDLSIKGFPNRTDLTLTDPQLVSPDGQVAWSAPFFQMLSLSYKRGHVIAAWPDQQSLMLPLGDYAVTSQGLRASLITDGELILRSNVESPVLNITGPDGAVAIAGLNVALQKTELEQSGYRLAKSIESLAISDPAIAGQGVPDALASLRADMRVTLDAPLTTDTLPSDIPNPTALALRTAEVSYGTFTFKADGEANIDTQGRATGNLTVEAENWRDALQAAEASGVIPPELAQGAVDLLMLLSSFGGQADKLDITLRFLDGNVMLGPIPVAELPRLTWR